MGTVRIKDHWAEQRLFESRALIAAILVVTLTLVLIGRLVVLQVMRYDYYAELSQDNRVRIEPLPAQRGLILDRNLTVLAENRPAFQLGPSAGPPGSRASMNSVAFCPAAVIAQRPPPVPKPNVSLNTIITLTGATLVLNYALVAVGAIVGRATGATDHSPYRMPAWPLPPVLAIAALVYITTKQTHKSLVVTGVTMLIGLIYWAVVIWPQKGRAWNRKYPILDRE